MATLTLNVVNINDINFLTVPTAVGIEDLNIKYVFTHKKANQYDTANSDVIYYDEQAATLAKISCEETPYDIFGMYAGFKLITAERLDSTESNKAMLINTSSTGYQVALSPKDPLSLVMIVYSALAGGVFNNGDIVTGDTTYATAQVVFDNGVDFMVVHPVKGTLSTADAISNAATPQVSADVDTYTAADQKYLQYEPGLSTAAKKKDIVARFNVLSVNRAVTSVDLANNTVGINGDHAADFTKDVPLFWDGSTANDGMYSVQSSYYDSVTTFATHITLNQPIPNYIADGTLKFA